MKKKNKLTQQDIVVLILGESDSPLPQSSIHEKVLNHPSFISNADHPERNISSLLTENKNKYFSQNKKMGPYTLSKKGREHYNVLTTDMKKLMLNNLDVVRFLTENHNIILHGAPGTGKTYLAREIAKAMCGVYDIKKLEESGQFKMVQFHPSYDYTDFVEGLRPTNKNEEGTVVKDIYFVRTDGVFKAFCKGAIESIEKVTNSKAYPTYDAVFKILYDKIAHKEITSYKCQKEYGIRIHDDQIQYEVAQGWRNYKYLETLYNYYIAKLDVELDKISSDDLNKVVEDDQITDANTIDYTPHKWAIKQLISIANELANKKQNDDLPAFIFLIDEINRGDMSKIFGELFFSIDPGYRANIADKDSIKVVDTQYQNLIPKEGDKNFEEKDADPFRKGFYIPDNVYIIGTMNDIDRSVESMDFAMRRRFQFIEVKPEHRVDAMFEDATDDNKKAEAKNRMTNLNNAIKSLGFLESYFIGPSYFMKLAKGEESVIDLWNYRLEGLLREYLRGEEESEAKAKLDKFKDAFGIDEDGNLKDVATLVVPTN